MIAIVRPVTVLLALGGQVGEEFYQDFRESGALDAKLGVFGPESGKALSPEAEGLTITLPAGRPDPAAVGIQPNFRIAGDFEITVAYEILSADQPQAGLGAGAGEGMVPRMTRISRMGYGEEAMRRS